MTNDKQIVEDKSLSEQITKTREAIALLELRLKDLENKAIEEIQYGKEIPGYCIKQQFGRYSWEIPSKDVEELGKFYGLNLVKPTKIETITPNQAIKLAKDNEEAINHIKSLSKSKLKGYKLVSENEQNDDELNFEDL